MSDFFLQFIQLVQRETNTPVPFGTWHIVSLICMIALTAILIIFFRKTSDRVMRWIVFGGWLIVVILEIAKQSVYSISIVDGSVVWSYNWSCFPFQFCSSPLYALPFVFLFKDCALRRGFIAFLASFSLLAGMVVMTYPNSVFTAYFGVNVQTMIHHGLQIVLGIYLFVYSCHSMKWKTFLGAILIFVVFYVTAIGLNEFLYNHALSHGYTGPINMFFISPYFYMDTELPIIVFLREYITHRSFVLLYAVAFPIGSLIIYSAEKGLARLFSGKKAKERL